MIFYSNGDLVRQIPRSDLHKTFFQKSSPFIVGMSFLPDETLFVLSRQGIYNMINPFTGDNKVYTLREIFFDENIVQAKIEDKMVVFYTSFKNQAYKFYFIRNIEAPVVNEFSHSEIRISYYEANNTRLCFLPIPPSCSFSGKIECFVSHCKLGAYRMIEDEVEKYEFVSHIPSSTLKKLPEIKEIQSMALSPVERDGPKMIALLNTSNVLHVIAIDPSQTNDILFKVSVLDDLDEEMGDERRLDKKLFWCGDLALVVAHGRYHILITLKGDFKRQIQRSKGALLIPEIDCLRIFSNEKCDILKLVPESYTNIFLPTSRAKAADLYNTYLEKAEGNFSADNSVLEDKKGLEESVDDIIDGAYFEIDPEEQKVLLKAAAYGKAFLGKAISTFRHDRFAEVCKNLRVMNALKDSKIGRVVTYPQFAYLASVPRRFIAILMKYQLFYFAKEIAGFLNYDKDLVSHIYVQWACCQIEQHPNDENLAEKIFERLKNDENASYVEVAHKAFEASASNERTRKELALKIVQYEHSIQKKVTFLLWIEQYEQALTESAKSLDPNLIDLVILKLSKDAEGTMIFWKMVSENPRTRPRLFKYIYDFKHQRIRKQLDPKKRGISSNTDMSKDMDYYLEKFASNDERGTALLLAVLRGVI